MSVKLKSSAGTRNVAEMSDLYSTIMMPMGINEQSLDDLLTPGVYYFNASSNITDLPTGANEYGTVIVLKCSSSVTKQIYTGFSGRLFMRSHSASSGWGSWYVLDGTAIS